MDRKHPPPTAVADGFSTARLWFYRLTIILYVVRIIFTCGHDCIWYTLQVLLSFALLAMAVCFAAAADQVKSQSATDRSKRGLIAPLVASPYVAAPYVASPYAAAPYAAVPYAAPYAVASPYAAPYVSSYAAYPYVAKTLASPYAYYPWPRSDTFSMIEFSAKWPRGKRNRTNNAVYNTSYSLYDVHFKIILIIICWYINTDFIFFQYFFSYYLWVLIDFRN